MRRRSGVFAATALILAASAGGAVAEQPKDPRSNALETLAELPAVALDAPGQEFAVRAVQKAPDGGTDVRVDRTLNGLPVIGGDLIIHQDASGDFETVSQTLDAPLSVDTAPEVSAATAASAARKLARQAPGTRARVSDSAPLVIDALGDEPRLAYAVTTSSIRPNGVPSKVLSYVDAETGKVLHAIEQVKTIDGNGRSLFHGNVPIQIAKGSWGTYVLRDDTRGRSQVFTLKNTPPNFCWTNGTCGNGSIISSWSTTFGNNATNDSATVGVDAAYGSAMFWDYFKAKFNRTGLKNDGAGLIAQVHYGFRIPNAYWQDGRATFGDGDNSLSKPMVDIDVVAHEFAHGLTEQTANLVYSGESGGLNESTSDIFGTMVEFYANNATNPGDYHFADKSWLQTGNILREMENPSADGQSPECYSPSVGSLDVHFSSAIGNKFFYLLAEGSATKTFSGQTHATTTCNGSTLTGIGRDKAAAIWYRALTGYFTTNTNYAAARVATIKAAGDLYGASSPEASAVAAAWSAVAVN